MESNFQVGIIGAGALGTALVERLSGAGVQCLISSTRPKWALAEQVARFGSNVKAAEFEDVVASEIVFLAVPWRCVPSILERVVDWEARIIVDATNPTDEDDLQPRDDGPTSSGLIAELASGAYVVKAFNTIPASVLLQPPGIGAARRVILYSGSNRRARMEIGRLIAAMGFSGIDLGDLETGGRMQQYPSGPLSSSNLLLLPG